MSKYENHDYADKRQLYPRPLTTIVGVLLFLSFIVETVLLIGRLAFIVRLGEGSSDEVAGLVLVLAVWIIFSLILLVVTSTLSIRKARPASFSPKKAFWITFPFSLCWTALTGFAIVSIVSISIECARVAGVSGYAELCGLYISAYVFAIVAWLLLAASMALDVIAWRKRIARRKYTPMAAPMVSQPYELAQTVYVEMPGHGS